MTFIDTITGFYIIAWVVAGISAWIAHSYYSAKVQLTEDDIIYIEDHEVTPEGPEETFQVPMTPEEWVNLQGLSQAKPQANLPMLVMTSEGEHPIEDIGNIRIFHLAPQSPKVLN
jgi:hypothetical protein